MESFARAHTGEWVRTNSSLLRESGAEENERVDLNADLNMSTGANTDAAGKSEIEATPPPPPPLLDDVTRMGMAVMADLAAVVRGSEGDDSVESSSRRPPSQKKALDATPLPDAAMVYPPLAGVKHSYASSMRMYHRLARQVVALQQTQRPDAMVGVMLPESQPRVRFVHVSDTHHHHRDVTNVPDGDVLIHTGDLVGNYGKGDDRAMLKQLKHSLGWLVKMVSRGVELSWGLGRMYPLNPHPSIH